MVKRLLLLNAIALLVYMSLAFLVARSRKRLDTVDAAWGGGFVVVAMMVAGQEELARSVFIAALVLVWATRLTSHIIERSRMRGEDPRYVAIANKWKGNVWLRAYFSIFLLQGTLIWIISLPIVLAANTLVGPAGWFIIVGAVVWAKGFVIELFADRQLQQFLANPKNKGKVLQSGLWRYSRHPNYFGEITQWFGIGLIACSARYGWISFIGPLLLALMIRYVSGVPPIEKAKQTDSAYQDYARRTSAILPWLPKQ